MAKGLIDTATDQGAAPPGLVNSSLPALGNPVLRQAEAAVEKPLGQGQARVDYLKVVVAGMRAGLSGGPDSMVAKLNASPDPVRDAAVGAVNLVVYLGHLSKGTMPLRTMIPAAMTLMLQALDFIDHAKIQPIGAADLDRATHIFANQVFTVFHITSPMLSNAAQMTHQVVQDPTKSAALHRVLGAGNPADEGQQQPDLATAEPQGEA